MEGSVISASLKSVIIETAYVLYMDGCKEYTMEDLAVATWKRHPQKAGMRGYEQLYPDFRAIYIRFCGSWSLKPCFNQRRTAAGIKLELNNDGITLARNVNRNKCSGGITDA